MKLIYRILIRLSLALLPIIALWGALFYFALENEINDEADDALERYSDYIMMRVLAGEQTPQHNDGTNNTYNLRPITIEFAFSVPHIEYYDSVINIVGTDEMEPARVLKTIFFDRKGQYYELTVSMPTFEKEDLIATILNWIIILYILLLLIVISMSGWVIYKSLKPLYALLDWLHNYIPGKKRHNIVDIKTDITEFNKLNQAVEIATNRSEELYEKQKQFIGNASHELQTPLSVINNRLDMLLDDSSLSEENIGELLKIKNTVNSAVKLNKGLLLLTKIENRQFSDKSLIDIVQIIKEQLDTFKDVYASKNITCIAKLPKQLIINTNESLAIITITNLIKNAFVHTPTNGDIIIELQPKQFSISNSGEKPLDKEHMFERFYQVEKKEGSTGLGLAIIKAIATNYNLKLNYHHNNGMHTFSIEN